MHAPILSEQDGLHSQSNTRKKAAQNSKLQRATDVVAAGKWVTQPQIDLGARCDMITRALDKKTGRCQANLPGKISGQ